MIVLGNRQTKQKLKKIMKQNKNRKKKKTAAKEISMVEAIATGLLDLVGIFYIKRRVSIVNNTVPDYC